MNNNNQSTIAINQKEKTKKFSKSTVKRTRKKSKKLSDFELIEMNFSCEQKMLSNCLDFVVKAIPKNPTSPILNNVLIATDKVNQLLHLSTYNLELGMQVSFPATVLIEGKVTVNGTILQNMIKKSCAGKINFQSRKKENSDSSIIVTVKNNDYNYFEIMGISADEFPKIPTSKQKLTTLNGELLITQLKSSLFVASSDRTKSILNGEHFIFELDKQSNKNLIITWTTDGHRLVLTKVEIDKSVKNLTSFTVPIKVLKELERNVNSNDTVTIYYEDKTVTFTWRQFCLVSKTIEGEYPDCASLVDSMLDKYNRQLTIDKFTLEKALSQLAVLTDKSVQGMTMKLDNKAQKIHLSIQHEEIGKGEITLDANIKGEDLSINLNVNYLLEVVKAITSFDLKFHLFEAHAPILVTPKAEVENNQSSNFVETKYLLAPLQ